MRLKLRTTVAGITAGALALAGCATRPASAPVEPSYAPILGAAPTPHAALYADCLAQAAASKRYDVVADSSSKLIRFTCVGDPARALYGAFTAWGSKRGSQWVREGRSFQSPQRVKRDLFGVDLCSTGGTDDYRCEIVLNVGDFLTQ